MHFLFLDYDARRTSMVIVDFCERTSGSVSSTCVAVPVWMRVTAATPLDFRISLTYAAVPTAVPLPHSVTTSRFAKNFSARRT